MIKINAILLAGLAIFILHLMPLDQTQALYNQKAPAASNVPVITGTPEAEETIPQIQASSQVIEVLENDFSSLGAGGVGEWQQWVIMSPEHPWEADELFMVRDFLASVIEALDDQGLDGRTLLDGYRFRRQHGEYISGEEGRIAVVNHGEQVITLADAAFKRLHGFYIIHELGHVVDIRTGRQLSAKFHELAGSNRKTGMTADGYWLNLHAKDDLEEATADAFALWIMSTYAEGYKPVFAFTPLTADYGQIATSLAASVGSISEF